MSLTPTSASARSVPYIGRLDQLLLYAGVFTSLKKGRSAIAAGNILIRLNADEVQPFSRVTHPDGVVIFTGPTDVMVREGEHATVYPLIPIPLKGDIS